jgi:hypothetical protein
MNAQAEAFELDQEMFAPGAQRDDALADHALLVDLGIPFDRDDALTLKYLRLLTQYD